MKRTVPLFVLVGVAGVLVPVLAVFAQYQPASSPKLADFIDAPKSCCPSSTCAKCKLAVASGDDKVIDELTAILKETKSSETFIVTAIVLGKMGAPAKRALPAIIRNAERLGVLESLYKSNDSDEACLAADLIGALDLIVDNQGGPRVWNGRSLIPAFTTPAMGYYGYTADLRYGVTPPSPSYTAPTCSAAPTLGCYAVPASTSYVTPPSASPLPATTPIPVKPAEPIATPTRSVPASKPSAVMESQATPRLVPEASSAPSSLYVQ